MTATGLFSTIVKASKILRDLENAGFQVKVSADFIAYRKMREMQSDRLPLYPVFDVSSSFIDASNAFWVCAFNDRNELVHTQVIRMLDLADTTLQDHLNLHQHKYLTPGMVSDPDEISFAPLLSLRTISGRVCYHGEFWLKAGDEGLRGQGYTALMSRLLFEIALNTWSPDFFFGFVPLKLAMKGIPFRYGYTRCEVGAWLRNGHEVVAEEALVWMSRSDLQQYLENAPKVLPRLEDFPSSREHSNSLALRA